MEELEFRYDTQLLIDGSSKKDLNEDKIYDYILDNFVELSKPISASQMKDITDSSFNFRQTMFSISEEAAKKIINYVRNNN